MSAFCGQDEDHGSRRDGERQARPTRSLYPATGHVRSPLRHWAVRCSAALQTRPAMDNDTEAYILLLLSDSNLPTGSFVASAGLESYVTHGFFSSSQSPPRDKMDATVDFLQDSLRSYARSALPFVTDAHASARKLLANYKDTSEPALASALQAVTALDDLYESMTLNHVARRASKAQGVALLTLYSKGFSRPSTRRQRHQHAAVPNSEEDHAGAFVDELKLLIRQEKTHGHLPICWGVLTACLGLSLGRPTIAVRSTRV